MAEQNLGGYQRDQSVPGVDARRFSVRTPQEGIPVGDILRLSGDYGQSSVEVTPQAMGIPQEAIDFFRLQNQQQKYKSYNVGITAFFPPGAVPEFMENVLRPTQARASFGQTRQSFSDITGREQAMSDRRRGIGGQAVLFGGPTVDVQYEEPNKFDRRFEGSVGVPTERGIVSLYGSRALNEGRPSESSVGVRGKFSF
tara:strand:- start:290 stop:883 length:594 start_codon:yes stop_codon:yes gene_type:complete